MKAEYRRLRSGVANTSAEEEPLTGDGATSDCEEGGGVIGLSFSSEAAATYK